MISQRHNDLKFFRFQNLSLFPELRHGIFTRNGGASQAPFHSLNTALSVGDDTTAVEENRRRIHGAMGAEGRLVFCRQVHGADILILSANGFHRRVAEDGTETRLSDTEAFACQCDAMITDAPDCHLVIQVADCQAVMVYAPDVGAVANIHSGWRGSVRDIIGRTVRVLVEKFGADPAEMAVGIGPSLGPCCAEFVNYQTELPESFWKYRDDRDHFNFWAASRDQLTAQGVRADAIHASDLCTKCRTDLFFSYRAERTTGRFAAVIGIQ